MAVTKDTTWLLSDVSSSDSEEKSATNCHEYFMNANKFDADGDDNVLTVDQILESLGPCGYFQAGITIIICLLNLPLTYPILLMFFTGHSPSWQCVKNNSECNISGIIEPSQIDLYKKRCGMNKTAWKYTTSKSFSLVTEFDLICDLTPMASLANSALYIGWGLACLPAGILADIYGRKPVYFFSNVILLLATFASGFITAVWQFILLRAIIGAGLTGASLTAFVTLSEIVGPRCRSVTSNILFTTGTIALLILTMKAYFIRDWRQLTIICSAPYFALLIFFICIPEPARWLSSKGKVGKALESLKKVAKVNKTPMPKCQLAHYNYKSTKGTFVDLFRGCQRLKVTLLLGFAWLVAGLTYYGLSLGSGDLSGNMYRDFALTCVIEIPANLIAPILLEKCGRKRTTIGAFLLAGLSCFCIAMLPEKSSIKALPVLRVICGMSGKLFISLAFGAIYIWSVELHPTVIRIQGMGFASFMARVGSSSSPFIVDVLKLVHQALPFILYGCFSVVAGIFGCFLTETKGKPTLETLDDDLSLLVCTSTTLSANKNTTNKNTVFMTELEIDGEEIEDFSAAFSDDLASYDELQRFFTDADKETAM